VWGSTILACVFVYAWSTAAFGLRFSNLTNRGIITDGPYRWLKHPAYVSKNLSWWLISVPFIAGAGWVTAVVSCLMMGAVNLIYYLRAKTEERHLRADPAYRAYEAYIDRNGLFARLLK
jgi:protein-S-isoprenylcysteine O-methyltransferase Ste14